MSSVAGLPAVDCLSRGVSNLRANWELVLWQLAQFVSVAVLTVVALVGVLALLGARFLAELGAIGDWTEALAALERLEDLSVGGGLLAILLAIVLTLGTVVLLVYSWFQAGVIATLERGERQAPPGPRVDWRSFRTFGWRDFAGWGGLWVWRFFWFFNWMATVAVVVVGSILLIAAVLAAALQGAGGLRLTLFGCGIMVPLVVSMMGLNLWAVLAMALLPRSEYGVWAACRRALTVLRHRLGGVLLIVLVFVIASVGLGLVFLPLTQGIANAVQNSVAARFTVEALLAVAQWLLSSVLSIALYASIIALVRTELDARPPASPESV